MNRSTFLTPFFGVVFLFLTNISFAQDLIVTGYSSGNTVEQYGTFSFTTTCKNQGIVATPSTYVSVYVSTDNILNSGDTEVGYVFLPTIAANASKTITGTTIEIRRSPGNYYLIVKVDSYNRVTETDETNNVFVAGNLAITTSNIDFQVASLSFVPNSVATFDEFTLTYKTQNNGTTVVNSIFTAFYLSTDNTFDAADIKLASSHGPVGTPTAENIPIPNVVPGSYFFLARADDGIAYSETNEGNNVVSRPITIVSGNVDLAVVSPAPTATYDPSQKEIQLAFALKNVGTTGVNGYQVVFYLSQDRMLDQYDVELYDMRKCTHYSYYVAPSQTISNTVYSRFNNEILSYELEYNLYYVIAKFNGDSSIVEPNYANDIAVSSNAISLAPSMPVNMLSASVSGTYNDKANSISLNAQIMNPGSSDFNDLVQYQVRIRNSSGAIVQTKSISSWVSIPSYGVTTLPFNLSITPLPAGNYTLLFDCQNSETCGYDSYSLSLTINPSSFSLNGSILDETGTPITSGKLFLYKKDASGKIAFTQKIDPVTTSNFNFQVDGQPYTLYFIPDPLVYPNAVPTILGKTTLLTVNSFVQLTANLTTPLVILQVQAPALSGSKIISGTVTSPDSPGGRVPMALQSITALPVILLSSSNVPTGITYTDASGHYEFKNLPEGNYKVVISMQLDQPQINAPIVADVTLHNAQVDFSITSTGIETNVKILQLAQTITFQSLEKKIYGKTSFHLDAHADSDLQATYISSNPSVAIITNNNEVSILGAGTTTITAYQSGSIDFLAARPVERELVVDRASQAITFEALPEKKFNESGFALTAMTKSNLPITFVSSNPAVAFIDNINQVILVSAGTTIITAYQTGNENYMEAEPVEQQLRVNKSFQSIAFSALPVKTFGDANFNLFAETDALLTATFSTSDPSVASIANNEVSIVGAGTVIITAYQHGNENYEEAVPVQRELIVNKAEQFITFETFPAIENVGGNFELLAHASSSLQVGFESDNESIASVSGNLVTIHTDGIVNITAYQQGDRNYNMASPVTHQMVVNTITGVEDPTSGVKVYPNPTSGILRIDIQNVKSATVSDTFGRERIVPVLNQSIDLSQYSPGIYYVKFIVSNTVRVVRIVRE